MVTGVFKAPRHYDIDPLYHGIQCIYVQADLMHEMMPLIGPWKNLADSMKDEQCCLDQVMGLKTLLPQIVQSSTLSNEQLFTFRT